MADNKKNFNYYESVFLKISLGLLGSSIVLFFLMFVFIDFVTDSTDLFIRLIVFLLLSSLASFLIAIFRIMKYAFKVSRRNDGSTITKSIISFFVSPTALVIYYIMAIILSLSSCSVQ